MPSDKLISPTSPSPSFIALLPSLFFFFVFHEPRITTQDPSSAIGHLFLLLLLKACLVKEEQEEERREACQCKVEGKEGRESESDRRPIT